MTESKEELKCLLMKVKEESETASLKLNIQKNKIMASGPITSLMLSWDPEPRGAGQQLTEEGGLEATVLPAQGQGCQWKEGRSEWQRV